MARAQYLLSLHGVDALAETDTVLAVDFLERQLERREAAAEAAAAGDARALEANLGQVRTEARELEQRVSSLLDVDEAWDAARGIVRELRFLTTRRDIDAMLASAETVSGERDTANGAAADFPSR